MQNYSSKASTKFIPFLFFFGVSNLIIDHKINLFLMKALICACILQKRLAQMA